MIINLDQLMLPYGCLYMLPFFFYGENILKRLVYRALAYWACLGTLSSHRRLLTKRWAKDDYRQKSLSKQQVGRDVNICTSCFSVVFLPKVSPKWMHDELCFYHMNSSIVFLAGPGRSSINGEVKSDEVMWLIGQAGVCLPLGFFFKWKYANLAQYFHILFYVFCHCPIWILA